MRQGRFLRSERSLISDHRPRRAPFERDGHSLRDTVTDSMKRAIGETDRRRAKQVEYNAKRGITRSAFPSRFTT